MHQNRIAVIESCANCPRGKINLNNSDRYQEKHQLYCFALHRVIPPSKHEMMADYYEVIPDDCPLPREVPV